MSVGSGPDALCVVCVVCCFFVFFFQPEDGIRDLVRSRGLGDVYKRQGLALSKGNFHPGNPGNYRGQRLSWAKSPQVRPFRP